MKFQSRKFIAFCVWVVFMLSLTIFKYQMSDVAVEWFGRVTLIYVIGQAIVDSVIARYGTK